MAYDTTEERLKVRGSEQITRDLKVNRDTFVLGNLEANKVKTNGDLDVSGEMIARRDLSVSGDLYVNGTEHINDTETAQTSDDYLVLRHNKTTALGANEHAGVVVHNYMPNKTATLTTDNTGTWRVADNTETDTNYSAISYYNGTYYDGLGQATSVTVIDGIKSAWDEDELDECVFYNDGYYHFDGTNYFTVELSGNVMVLGAMITDPDVITALEALTGNDLVYYRSLTVTTISEVENEPILTRDEASNLSNGHVLVWDATTQKAVDGGLGGAAGVETVVGDLLEPRIIDLSNRATSNFRVTSDGASAIISGKNVQIIAHAYINVALGQQAALILTNLTLPPPANGDFVPGACYLRDSSSSTAYKSAFCAYNPANGSLVFYNPNSISANSLIEVSVTYISE